ncbi:MAG TPA: hypothetical protein VFW65_31205 [Pseudonocardiaceae bacterium]|nr:hypothetical protein [Pseudonocardiaceae bacterium]
MTIAAGERSLPSSQESGSSSGSARETRPTGIGRGAVVSAALGVGVAALISLIGGHSAEIIVAAGVVAAMALYLATQGADFVEQLRIASKNTTQCELALRTAIVQWLERLRKITDDERDWTQCTENAPTWRRDLDHFAVNMEALRDSVSSMALSALTTHLANLNSFAFEAVDTKEFMVKLNRLTRIAIEATEQVQGRRARVIIKRIGGNLPVRLIPAGTGGQQT